MVSIFPNPCLWRRSLRSNLGGIDLEKLYRATLSFMFYVCLCCGSIFFPLLENSLSYITMPKNKQKSNLNKDKIEPQDIL